jgi:hypothetical protein
MKIHHKYTVVGCTLKMHKKYCRFFVTKNFIISVRQGTGDMLIDYVSCFGNPKSLFECYLRLKGTYSYNYCQDNHMYDAAVQCFNNSKS